MVILQPCDWIESDDNFKYVLDVFGRTDDGSVAKLRLTGFKPYFYLRSAEGETAEQIKIVIENICNKSLKSMVIKQENKLEAMRIVTGKQ